MAPEPKGGELNPNTTNRSSRRKTPMLSDASTYITESTASHDAAEPRPAPQRRPVLGAALALAAAAFVLVLIWGRTAFVPGASTGDEIWWSESGYFFMKEGVLRWASMANERGSQILSYWPPLPALVQALMLKVFGVNAWGVNAQTSLVASLVIVVTYGLGRVLSLSRSQALWASVAIFGLFSVERRLLIGRMENLTALLALVFALLLLRAASADKSRRQLLEIMSGLVLGLGFFTYYPQSPFLALASGATILILQPGRWLQCATNIALGALPSVLAGALWILPHLDLFKRQVLEVASSHYTSSDVFWHCIKMLCNISQLSYWLLHTERWIGLIFSLGCCWWVRNPKLRALSAMAAVLTLPMFAYTWSPNVVSAAPGVLCVVIIFRLAQEVTIKSLAVGVAALQSFLVFFACAKLVLIDFSAFYQRDGRDYQAVATALTESVSGDGPVAIEQRAWLGLRERVPADRLNLLPGVGATVEFAPEVARRKDADEYFRYLVVEKDVLPTLCRLYPWLDRGIQSGRFHLIREIAPPFRPLPWAHEHCYDLLVYARKD
jgi:hypothetical protein